MIKTAVQRSHVDASSQRTKTIPKAWKGFLSSYEGAWFPLNPTSAAINNQSELPSLPCYISGLLNICNARLPSLEPKHPADRHVCVLRSLLRSHPAPRRGPDTPHVLEDTPSATAAFTECHGLRGLNKNLLSSGQRACFPESSLPGLQMVIFCALTCSAPCTCLCLNLPFL